MTSIFREMHNSSSIGSWEQYDDLVKRLKKAIEQGIVKEISPSSEMIERLGEMWYVEMSSGVVFRLASPNPPAFGTWEEVEFPERKII